jgi:phosphate transport system substrate-binding protein
MNHLFSSRTASLPVLALTCALALTGCGKSAGPGGGRKQLIANIGSDTMVNLATAWAEEYAKVQPTVSVEVSGGGSGQGVAALINGSCDLASCSRKLEESEVAALKAKRGQEPREFLVGYDALSIFVHKSNPLNELSLEELGEIYGERGRIQKWSQLGVQVPGARDDEVIRVSRQNNSGTYHYFKEVVLGKAREFRLGSLDMNGSKEVVELVAKTPGAIGYSGMGYATPEVKTLKVARQKGEPAVAPTIATALDKSYPIARPLFMYTAGEPAPHVRQYLDWVRAEAGQKVLEATGYIPLPRR